MRLYTRLVLVAFAFSIVQPALGQEASWMSLVARRWNGGRSPYSPTFFFGIVWKGERDEAGYKVYEVDDVF